MKLRFAALRRVSTEAQEAEGESLRTQRDQLTQYVAELGGEIASWYGGQEHATEGHEKREIDRLVADAQKGKFNAVIVTTHDRWSRDPASAARLDIFRNHNIKFFTGTTEWNLFDPSHALFLGLNAEIGKFFAGQQARKSLENKIARAKRGIPCTGKLPYGRRWIRSADKQTGTWEVDAKAQAVVKEVARRYLAGEGVEKLGREFKMNVSNLWKILTKTSGSTWTVRFASKRLNIDETVAIPVPPLLDEETIRKIHLKAAANKTYSHGQIKYQYLFARMISCAHCGNQLSGQTNHNGKSYYRHAHADRVKPCPGPASKTWVPIQHIENAVMRHLFDTFGNPAAVKRAVDAATPNRAKMQAAAERLEKLGGELEKNSKARARILDLVIKEALTDAQAESKLNELKEREAELTQERACLSDTLAHVPNAEAVAGMAVKIGSIVRRYTNARATAEGRLASACLEGMSFADKQALVRSVFAGKGLDGKRLGVRISWTTDGTDYRYQIHGNLVNVEDAVTSNATPSLSTPSHLPFTLSNDGGAK